MIIFEPAISQMNCSQVACICICCCMCPKPGQVAARLDGLTKMEV